jgi:hypothetical protein
MAGLKFTLDKEKYEIDLDKVTLGEGRYLKREFGMKTYDALGLLDPDPDILVGLLAVCIKRAHPELSEAEVLEKVEAIDNGDYFDQATKHVHAARKKAEAALADPQPAGGSASAPARNGGSSATPRKTPGRRSSQKS